MECLSLVSGYRLKCPKIQTQFHTLKFPLDREKFHLDCELANDKCKRDTFARDANKLRNLELHVSGNEPIRKFYNCTKICYKINGIKNQASALFE